MSLEQLINPTGPGLVLNVASCNVQSALSPSTVAFAAATASQNFPAAWSGKLITIPQVTVNTTLILGDVGSCAGQNFRARFSAVGDGTHTVTFQVHSSVTSLKGVLGEGTSTGVHVAVAANYQIACANNIPAGTWLNFECDGVSWYVQGFAALASAFTVT